MKRGYLVVLLSIVLVSGVAAAWQQPEVEYSADSYMETVDSVMQGPLHVARGKERREYVQDGQRMVTIIRHDKKLMWALMPEDKIYMEMKMTEESKTSKDDLSNYKIEQTTVGLETVNGVNTAKSKIIMTGRRATSWAVFGGKPKRGSLSRWM